MTTVFGTPCRCCPDSLHSCFSPAKAQKPGWELVCAAEMGRRRCYQPGQHPSPAPQLPDQPGHPPPHPTPVYPSQQSWTWSLTLKVTQTTSWDPACVDPVLPSCRRWYSDLGGIRDHRVRGAMSSGPEACSLWVSFRSWDVRAGWDPESTGHRQEALAGHPCGRTPRAAGGPANNHSPSQPRMRSNPLPCVSRQRTAGSLPGCGPAPWACRYFLRYTT